MKAFGFLSFGHHAVAGQRGPDARQVLRDQLELARAADDIGVNGAYFRVHHFAPQGAAPMPLLGAIAGSTERIEVGTGVIDMRYENPLHLAEEAAALDLLADNRIALGVSRGSPEPAIRGWESFGHTATTPNGADLARATWERFLAAVDGQPMATAASAEEQYPQLYRPGKPLAILPSSPGLRRRLWWGAGTMASAEQAARDGVNLMSSTLVLEADGSSLGEIQARQIEHYRHVWREVGHDWTPRVSVSRTIFPLVTERDHRLFGLHGQSGDQIGILDARQTTFSRTYAAEPDVLIEQLRADAAVAAADTVMITIPNVLGVEVNLSILANFAEHVAPALGWQPSTAGPVTGYPVV